MKKSTQFELPNVSRHRLDQLLCDLVAGRVDLPSCIDVLPDYDGGDIYTNDISWGVYTGQAVQDVALDIASIDVPGAYGAQGLPFRASMPYPVTPYAARHAYDGMWRAVDGRLAQCRLVLLLDGAYRGDGEGLFTHFGWVLSRPLPRGIIVGEVFHTSPMDRAIREAKAAKGASTKP